jgi:ribosomal protein S18 acetylase RimI-like enzyme
MKEYQQEGNGTKAYAMLEEEIKKCRYKSIRLNVGTKNIPAMIFWIKNGYTKIVRYYPYENGFLDINLEKEIT